MSCVTRRCSFLIPLWNMSFSWLVLLYFIYLFHKWLKLLIKQSHCKYCYSLSSNEYILVLPPGTNYHMIEDTVSGYQLLINILNTHTHLYSQWLALCLIFKFCLKFYIFYWFYRNNRCADWGWDEVGNFLTILSGSCLATSSAFHDTPRVIYDSNE